MARTQYQDREIDRAVVKIKELQNSTDTESAHKKADNILCDVFLALGIMDLVEEYKKVDKWYA